MKAELLFEHRGEEYRLGKEDSFVVQFVNVLTEEAVYARKHKRITNRAYVTTEYMTLPHVSKFVPKTIKLLIEGIMHIPMNESITELEHRLKEEVGFSGILGDYGLIMAERQQKIQELVKESQQKLWYAINGWDEDGWPKL